MNKKTRTAFFLNEVKLLLSLFQVPLRTISLGNAMRFCGRYFSLLPLRTP